MTEGEKQGEGVTEAATAIQDVNLTGPQTFGTRIINLIVPLNYLQREILSQTEHLFYDAGGAMDDEQEKMKEYANIFNAQTKSS